jgi:RNA polymerase sigma-70 factor (ECF subfamily)
VTAAPDDSRVLLGLEEVRVRRTVLAARSGNSDAMRELYERHAGRVHSYVLKLLGDHHDADDVTQQVFAKLMTELDRYRPGQARFQAWILRVAHNAAIDHVRRTRAVPYEHVIEPDAWEDGPAGDARHSLQAALASLPPAQRDVLLLTHVVGLSPSEIAARLGRSVRSIHGLHYRARAAARLVLNELDSAPATATRLSPRSWRAPAHALSA